MIGFRSGEAACGYCPLSFLCLRGKPLVFDKRIGDTYLGDDYLFHKKKIQFNEFKVQYCPRCFCVHFSIRNERYLCGILRTGIMTPGHANGQGPVYAAVGGMHRRGTQTSGCMHKSACHPLSFAGVPRQKLAILSEKDDAPWVDEDGNVVETDDYDCFDEFAKVLTEVR